MCWNAEVSLNTFIFSSFVLLLIIYNNTYTKYKIKELTVNAYIFLMSFILMQLLEYFIWRNINNAYYNNIFSLCASFIIVVQPVASLMMLTNETLKTSMIFMYLFLAIPYSIYQYSINKIYSSVTPMGHLNWHFFNGNLIETICKWLVYLFFFLFSLFYNGNYVGLIFGISILSLSIYNYYKDVSITSMWCWLINSIMVYYAVYLLFYLPYQDIRS